MIETDTQKYKTISAIILSHRNSNKDWDTIYSFGKENEEELQETLNGLALVTGVDNLTVEYWHEAVENEKHNEECGMATVFIPSCIVAQGQNNNFKLDNSKGSAWTCYKTTLKKNGFDDNTINMIQTSSHKILNKLSLNTVDSGPVKGMVIGNVQSGKTANMAALMAMAADVGFNMFIVLSGTIENLRIQTLHRFLNDLKATNISWHTIDNVSVGAKFSVDALQNLNLNDGCRERYLMVVLKNSNRLKNLLKWLKKDLKTRKKLKILFIDDEADQAGINASKYDKSKSAANQERTMINKLLVDLLTNKDDEHKEVETPIQAMNYVAYTATPYANVLNEKPGKDSIYPSNFVACLGLSNLYFGPQTIFGLPEENIDGLDIINIVPDDEIENLSGKKSANYKMTKSLEQAILWFYCCFAIRKFNKVIKPVSMLIHTSQQQVAHREIARIITNWINKLDPFDFLRKCEQVYKEQTNKLTLDNFHDSYSNYGLKVDDYPSFDKISNLILEIYNEKIKTIKIDDNGDLKFNKGVNLCVDNCSNNFVEGSDEYIRLIYPDDKSGVDFTTGFIIIGGATLSRGLTIEGLVSSYFIRPVKQADTLMQMGRWFGYRKGYELLPRIWLTEQCKERFEFLSILDYELRNEIKYMEDTGISPSLVGIKVRRNPKKSFLDITSKNKQKAAKNVEMDFSGLSPQTTNFYSDESKLKQNLDATSEFINSIGDSIDNTNNFNSKNTLLWENVDSDKVVDYISKLKFPKNDASFLNVDFFSNWYDKIKEKKVLNNWNVAVAGVKEASENDFVTLGKYKVCKVNRSKKKQTEFDDGLIRIGALRSIKDVYSDIKLDNPTLSKDDVLKIKANNSKEYRMIRNKAGLGNTPLLIIYVIDKNSTPRDNVKNRVPMNTENDVVGIMILIPSAGTNTGCYVSIKIDSDNSTDDLINDEE